MKEFFIATVLALTLPMISAAQSTKKGKLSTDLYEKDKSESSISGKVKAVREVQEETEVFIDTKGNSGPYLLPQNIKNRAKLIQILNKSQKPGGPTVTISIDEQDHIKSVEENESSVKKMDMDL
ncbi:hypothetical protein [Bdellovibrio sp. HCB337]|uniref:hypothetical protein n=1 Tax=Bdellovibrio sp. HCB337 TaxID=3394358 RepID=UPI0039A778A4